MGPLIPFCSSLACDGAASGQPDRGLAGLMLQAVDRQAPVAESDSLVHDIGIDFQAGGDHGVNDSLKDGKKDLDGRGEGSGSDVTASTSSIPYRDIYIDGSSSDGNSSSDDAHSSDSSYVSGEYYDSDDDEEPASSSTTSSAISSLSSLQSLSSSFYSSSEDSILTTASSRHDHPSTATRNNQSGGRNDAAVVLIGCRMCLTYYMVSKPVDACPRCGDQGNHIVRFGG